MNVLPNRFYYLLSLIGIFTFSPAYSTSLSDLPFQSDSHEQVIKNVNGENNYYVDIVLQDIGDSLEERNYQNGKIVKFENIDFNQPYCFLYLNDKAQTGQKIKTFRLHAKEWSMRLNGNFEVELSSYSEPDAHGNNSRILSLQCGSGDKSQFGASFVNGIAKPSLRSTPSGFEPTVLDVKKALGKGKVHFTSVSYENSISVNENERGQIKQIESDIESTQNMKDSSAVIKQ